MSYHYSKIAILGANGNLGPFILRALQSAQIFKITVLTRLSSKSTYPPTVTITKLPDTLPHDALVSALTGQEVLILALSGAETAVQLKLIDAAVVAGVKRIIPADFGSCDSSDPRSLDVVNLYVEKKKVRDHLISLAAESKITWTSIICGHFLDYGLQGTLWLIDIPKRKGTRFDGGDIVFSASMLRTVGAAVVGILLRPEETKDQLLYVQSVRTTWNELLEMVEKVIGGEKFEVEDRGSDDFIKERKRYLEEHPGDAKTIEELVGVEGIVNGDWIKREGFANELLGLEDEDLEALVRESLA